MLSNRRQALIGFGLTAIHGGVRSIARPFASWLWTGTTPDLLQSESSLDLALDDRLRADLERLAPRAYSEEGVPMFLACVDLVPARSSQPAGNVTLTPLSSALASTLHKNAEAYRRIRPAAKVSDVAPLIEVLADRDFSGRGPTEGL